MAERWRPAQEWDPAPDDVIDIWRFDLEVQENDWAILSPDEAQTAKRIVVAEKRDRKASARAHLRRILARYVGTHPRDVKFAYGEHGKPMLAEQKRTRLQPVPLGVEGARSSIPRCAHRSRCRVRAGGASVYGHRGPLLLPSRERRAPRTSPRDPPRRVLQSMDSKRSLPESLGHRTELRLGSLHARLRF